MLPVFEAILAGVAVMWIAAALLFATGIPLAHVEAWLLVTLGLLAFLIGFTGLQVGLQLLKPVFGPTAVILPRQPGDLETWIELRSVHPAFVTAMEQLRAAHTSQSAGLS